MKIEDFGALQMMRTNPAHTGTAPLSDIAGAPYTDIPSAAVNNAEKKRVNFNDYLLNAMQKMNDQQVDVTNLEQKLVTDPDSVDIQDVTVAVAKARMSLNLAQTVIDRIVTGWSEITTTR